MISVHVGVFFFLTLDILVCCYVCVYIYIKKIYIERYINIYLYINILYIYINASDFLINGSKSE